MTDGGIGLDERAAGLAEHERVRRELMAAHERMRLLEAQRDVLQAVHEAAVAERDTALAQTRTLTASESYRFGLFLVSLVKDPVRTVGRLTRELASRASLSARRWLHRRAGGASPAPARRLPVRLYVALGLGQEQLRRFARDTANYATVTADHRAVVVTDCPTFSLLRNLGVVLEYVPDRSTWERHRDEAGWNLFLARRLARIVRDHGADRAIVVDAVRPPDLAELIARGDSDDLSAVLIHP